MNPLSLYVLVVETLTAGAYSYRTFVDTSQDTLEAFGKKLVRDAPAEATSVSFEIVPAEGVS